jgi:hypothetical protein
MNTKILQTYKNLIINYYGIIVIMFLLILSCRINKVGVMVVNSSFNDISAMSWRSVLLVEETRIPGETHRPPVIH